MLFHHLNAKIDYLGTPLSIAASHGKVEMVKLLLENGADVNAKSKSKDGSTPLELAQYVYDHKIFLALNVYYSNAN